MDSISGAGAQLSMVAGALAGAIKDSTGAQVVNKTLEHMNQGQNQGQMGGVSTDFQTTVLNAAGIGTKLDTVA